MWEGQGGECSYVGGAGWEMLVCGRGRVGNARMWEGKGGKCSYVGGAEWHSQVIKCLNLESHLESSECLILELIHPTLNLPSMHASD